MTDPTLGAALYFDPSDAGPIPVRWLDEALRVLGRTGVPVHECSVGDVPGFVPPETVPFGPNEDRVRAALASGGARSIYLHGHSTQQKNLVLSCQATAGLSRAYGYGYVVVPDRPGLSLGELLLAAHELTGLVARCRYGIGYRRSAHLSPSLYARGMLGSSGETPDWEDLGTRDRIFRFFGQRRHLHDGFRSIYPAQLLSEEHRQVRLATGVLVGELGLGRWTRVDGGLWLWELSDVEVPLAKELFERSGLLLAA